MTKIVNNKLIVYNKWMEKNMDKLKNKPINKIILPGSVNSFSYKPDFNYQIERKETIYMFMRKLTGLAPNLKSLLYISAVKLI